MSNTDRNQHVKEFLKYYVNFENPPRYAVLLNGPWGIGKTFLIKQFMGAFDEKLVRRVYVSLYGLSTLDEVDDALFRAMYPLLDNKGVQIAGRVVKAIGKYVNVDPEIEIKNTLNKANADLFIFDDLERCDVPINRILGYINEFVEHENRKVIIVANEKEIKSGEDYRRIREKLIGKTLELQSVFESALDYFIASVAEETVRQFFTSNVDIISTIYKQSELHNLRILEQTMWDFQRIYTSIDEKHKGDDSAMTTILSLVMALSFEVKSGRLDIGDLRRRQYTLISAKMRSRREDGAPPALTSAEKRYPEINLGTTILSDETIVNILGRGFIDGVQIREELDASSFFVSVAEEPAWRTVWHAFERTDEEFGVALIEMERAFFAQEFIVLGEVLHVFGLRLWLSDAGVISKTREEVVTEGKGYIDSLYESGRLETSSQQDGVSEFRFSGYGGLAIFESNTSGYRELFNYLTEKRNQTKIDMYPSIAQELLSNATEDPDLFFRRVNITNSGENEFYNVPVLAALDPGEFVAAIVEYHPAQQRSVLIALKTRYEHGALDSTLREERCWAIELRNRLFDAAETMSAISKYRIRHFVHQNLDEALGLGAYAVE